MGDTRLINRYLIWAPGTDELTEAQMDAIRNRHEGAIRPIPSRTALGYDHLMADADRGALIAEVDRLWAERYRTAGTAQAPPTSLLAGSILLVSYPHLPQS